MPVVSDFWSCRNSQLRRAFVLLRSSGARSFMDIESVRFCRSAQMSIGAAASGTERVAAKHFSPANRIRAAFWRRTGSTACARAVLMLTSLASWRLKVQAVALALLQLQGRPPLPQPGDHVGVAAEGRPDD
jgi:hypothetical protein